MSKSPLYAAAIAAGLTPERAERYVRYVAMCEAKGKKPLTPKQAADAPRY